MVPTSQARQVVAGENAARAAVGKWQAGQRDITDLR